MSPSRFRALLAHVALFQTLAVILRIAMTYAGLSAGLGPFWIGLIGGIFGLLPAAMAVQIGRFIDRTGERRALITGSSFVVIAALGLVLLPVTLGGLLEMSLILGLGQFLGVAAQQSATARAGGRDASVAFGWMTLANSLAQTAGPLVVGWSAKGALMPQSDLLFQVGAAMAIGALFLAALLELPGHTRKDRAPSPLIEILSTKGFFGVTAVSVVVLATTELLLIYLPLFGAERGIDATTMGWLLALRGSCSVVSRVIFAGLLRRLGKRGLLIWALAGSGVALALLPFCGSVWALASVLAFLGFALGVGAPLTLSWLAEIVPPSHRGAAFALRLAMNRAGQFVLPVTAASALGAIGVSGVLGLMAGALICGAGLVLRMPPPR